MLSLEQGGGQKLATSFVQAFVSLSLSLSLSFSLSLTLSDLLLVWCWFCWFVTGLLLIAVGGLLVCFTAGVMCCHGAAKDLLVCCWVAA